MNLERGLYRLTLAVSVVLLVTGLVLTVREVYRSQVFVVGTWQLKECLQPVTSESRESANYKARLRFCEDTVEPHPIPPLVEHLARIMVSLHSAGITTDMIEVRLLPMFETPRLLSALAGGTLTVTLAALPWAMFYAVRWIVRGFRSGSRESEP